MQPTTASTTGTDAARVMAILGFVFAAVAVFFFPIVFGPAAIILGTISTAKGDRLGKWAIVAGLVGMVAGFALAAAVLNAAD